MYQIKKKLILMTLPVIWSIYIYISRCHKLHLVPYSPSLSKKIHRGPFNSDVEKYKHYMVAIRRKFSELYTAEILYLWNSSKPSTWDILGVMLSRTLPGLLALESRRCRVEAAAVAEATLIVSVTCIIVLTSCSYTRNKHSKRRKIPWKAPGIMITLTHTQIHSKALFH